MTAKKELQLAYGIGIVFLVIGILSYAAFSAKPPEEPVRIMFKVTAGKVLFTHKTHAAEGGYGIDCFTCHHHPEGDDAALRACGDCHSPSEERKTASASCRECHDEGELDSEETPKRADAFHDQCTGCHKEKDAGPKECSECHVL
jgi:hypothetical protein